MSAGGIRPGDLQVEGRAFILADRFPVQGWP